MKRLSGIEIYNFKNIKSAKLDFKNSMLGLYGENGSGKTALIDVLNLVKTVLCGQSISSDFLNSFSVSERFILSTNPIISDFLSYNLFLTVLSISLIFSGGIL